MTHQTRPALLIVDVQNGFINAHTSSIPTLVERLQNDYETVVATRFNNQPGSPYRKFMNWGRFAPGTDDVGLAFNAHKNVLVWDKDVYTCIDDKFLDFLASRSIDEVHVCGIDTDVCVTKCAVDLFEAGIRPVVLSTYCASHGGPSYHDAALQILRRYIGPDQIR